MNRAGSLRVAMVLMACVTAQSFAAQQKTTTMPDWSGEWELVGVTPTDGGLYVESAADMAARWNRPPYNNDARQVAFRDGLQRKQLAAAGNPASTGDNGPTAPGFACSFGFPLLMVEAPATFEALITRRQTALVFSTREVRNIYTDGRAHLPADEIWPTYWGDSIGHWEGQTLVVDTIAVISPFTTPAMKALGVGTLLGIWGGADAPPVTIALFSGAAHFTERLRLLDSGLLENEMTIEDAAALSSPWKITRQYRRVNGVNRLVFQDCEGDTRHPIVNGAVELQLAR